MSCIQCELVVPRGGFTVKLMKLKPLTCTRTFQSPGGSRYSISHLIFYPFLKGAPTIVFASGSTKPGSASDCYLYFITAFVHIPDFCKINYTRSSEKCNISALTSLITSARTSFERFQFPEGKGRVITVYAIKAYGRVKVSSFHSDPLH